MLTARKLALTLTLLALNAAFWCACPHRKKGQVHCCGVLRCVAVLISMGSAALAAPSLSINPAKPLGNTFCSNQGMSSSTPSSQALLPLGSHSATAWQVNASHADLTRSTARPVRPHTIAAHGKSITLDLSRTALIVIDMQNDFCHPQGWLASIGVDVAPARAPIAPLAQLLPIWRSQNLPVLWINWGNRPDRANLSPAALHVYNPDGKSSGLGAQATPLSKNVLEKDSWGAAVVDELAPQPQDICIDKFRMSGFWDTPLDSSLRQMGMQTLLFAGVNADQCVLATLMDANFAGYDTILLEDASATTSPDFCWQATLYNVRQCFGFTTLSTEFLNLS
jgi:nicotinamidase-related amidase